MNSATITIQSTGTKLRDASLQPEQVAIRDLESGPCLNSRYHSEARPDSPQEVGVAYPREENTSCMPGPGSVQSFPSVRRKDHADMVGTSGSASRGKLSILYSLSTVYFQIKSAHQASALENLSSVLECLGETMSLLARGTVIASCGETSRKVRLTRVPFVFPGNIA